MATNPTGHQKIITLPLQQALLDLVDESREGEPRSMWIRRAMAEKLRRLGAEVPDRLVNPPDQTGKASGPRKRKKAYEVPEKEGLRAAEEPGQETGSDESPR